MAVVSTDADLVVLQDSVEPQHAHAGRRAARQPLPRPARRPLGPHVAVVPEVERGARHVRRFVRRREPLVGDLERRRVERDLWSSPAHARASGGCVCLHRTHARTHTTCEPGESSSLSLRSLAFSALSRVETGGKCNDLQERLRRRGGLFAANVGAVLLTATHVITLSNPNRAEPNRIKNRTEPNQKPKRTGSGCVGSNRIDST